MKRQKLTVLGASGSIGVSTLDVVARHPDRYEVVALTGNSRIEVLLEQYRLVQKGISSLVTVAGYSGVGKSALLQEVRTPIVENNGFFISGKFEQFKRDTPYSAIAQAFQELFRQYLQHIPSVAGQGFSFPPTSFAAQYAMVEPIKKLLQKIT